MKDDPELLSALAAASPLMPLSDEQRAEMTKEGVLRDSALWYARSLGWPVFPLAPGGKVPAVKNGFKVATTDPAAITEWWNVRPHANIGTPTGLAFDVIDIDAPDGFATWATYREQMLADGHAMPPLVGISHTGSGGRHLLVAAQGARNGVALGTGLDYRGRGGYIVLPPSQLSSGGIYRWVKRP